MVLYNASKNTIVAENCHFANSVLKRMVGLLGRKSLAVGEGLLFDRCYGIHTFGMRFPIDVVFIDRHFNVMRAVKALSPWRTCAVRQAVFVLELPVGVIDRAHIEEGDQIRIRSASPEALVAIAAAANGDTLA